MSFRIAGAAWKVEDIHPTTKLILLCLADTADDDGTCWPSQGTVAKKCGVSRQTVNSHIEKLCKSGFLQKHRRKREDGSDMSSILVITLPPSCFLQGSHKGSYPPVKSFDTPCQNALHPPVKSFDTMNLSVEPIIEPNTPPISPQGEAGKKDKSSSRPKRNQLTDPPDDLPEETIADLATWAKNGGLRFDREMVEACLDFHRAKGNRYKDWTAAVRTWARNQAKFEKDRQPDAAPKGAAYQPWAGFYD